MNWTVVRGLTYIAMLIASGMAFLGVADFDPRSGMLTIYPFNLYATIGAVAGLISSALASIALLKGWGRK